MLKGVTTVYLMKKGKYGITDIFGDVNINFSGKDINDGCYVSELRYGFYGAEFDLTSDEIESIETMAKELVASKKHIEYAIDLVNKTVSKY